jgi:UDP-N-acetylglucosamine 2-epimerase (non-hydrolysing)
MSLVKASACIVTDSGGVQEETTYLGIPCLTLRRTTERPITVSEGTNRLVEPDDLVPRIEEIRGGAGVVGRRPEMWDGRTAARIVRSMEAWLRG